MRLLIALSLATLAACPALATEGWETDFEAAKQQATEAGKDLLVEFTGSDWCAPCQALAAQVFRQDAFNGEEDFVLVSLDFPRDSSKMPESLIQQNRALQHRYNVTGFPTVLLMDADGFPYAKTGYRQGGAEAYNVHLQEIKAQKTARDQAFADADAAQTAAEKIAKLTAAFGAMPDVDPKFYPQRLAELARLDPDSELVRAARADLGVESLEERVARFKQEIADNKLEGEELQQALFTIDRVATYATIEDEIEVLERVLEAAPRTRRAQNVRTILADLELLAQTQGQVIPGWESNLDQAKAKAQAEGKDLLLVVAPASDDEARVLKDVILAQPGFDPHQRFVHVWVDVPAMRRYSKAEPYAEHSAMLRATHEYYHVTRYPQVFLIEPNGVPYARIMEFASVPDRTRDLEAYNEKLDTLYLQRATRDAAFARADALPVGHEKARQLLAGFEAMPVVQPWHYPQRLELLSQLLPEDDWFFRLRATEKRQFSRAELDISAARIRREIAEQNLQGEPLQIKRMVLHGMIRHDSLETELADWQSIIDIEPDSRHGKLAVPHLVELQAKLASQHGVN